jgi:hypothetical protein
MFASGNFRFSSYLICRNRTCNPLKEQNFCIILCLTFQLIYQLHFGHRCLNANTNRLGITPRRHTVWEQEMSLSGAHLGDSHIDYTAYTYLPPCYDGLWKTRSSSVSMFQVKKSLNGCGEFFIMAIRWRLCEINVNSWWWVRCGNSALTHSENHTVPKISVMVAHPRRQS